MQNEVLTLPDIVEIMGPRPFPMKESVAEYLSELKEREVVDAKIAEDQFNAWYEQEKAKAGEEGGDSEAFAAIEKEVEESKERGETVQVYGKRLMDKSKAGERAAKINETKFDQEAAEQAEKEAEDDKKKE